MHQYNKRLQFEKQKKQQMSDSGSVNFDMDDSLHIQPLKINSITRMPNRLFQISNPNPSLIVNSCMNVLNLNKLTDKMVVNQKFEQYLVQDISNPDTVIVSVLGNKKVGKSFLIDSLLTTQYGKICRIMCKSTESIVNSPAIVSKTKSNLKKLIYFDFQGDPTHELFLWGYFLSSVLVFNLNSNFAQNKDFIQHLNFIKSHLDWNGNQLSLPQLIILKRDSQSPQQKIDRDFIRQIQALELFQPSILVFNIPYPGNRHVTTKQLLDVPLKQISQQYQNQIEKLLTNLKLAKTKSINGHYFSTKLVSLALEPTAKSINKEHRIITSKVWDELIENLSIGYYNYYLKRYEDELTQELSSQKPCDKYALYKKLFKVKRKVDKKVENFKSLDSDPTFSKYKIRLGKAIQSKQNLIKHVNQQKSNDANQQFCKRLLSELTDQNCNKLIQQYCKSGLDDKKADVLLLNIQNVIGEKTKKSKKKNGNSNDLKRQISQLEKQINSINAQLKQKSKSSNIQIFDFRAKKFAIDQKKSYTQKLKGENTKLKQNLKKLSQSRKPNAELYKFEEQCSRLNEKISKNQKEATQLRRQREQITKELMAQLQQKLKEEQQLLRKQEERLREAKKRLKLNEGNPKKDKGCCCSIM